MSNPNLNNPPPARQGLGAIFGGRTSRKSAHLSGEPVTVNKSFSIEQRTYQDPQTGDVVTEETGSHHLLACGCRVSSPSEIRGVCPGCSSLKRTGAMKKPRLICGHHQLCLRCRQKKIRDLQGGGILRKTVRFFLTILLWPLFDVYKD